MFFSKPQPRSRLLKFAILISLFTIIWNVIEGVISIIFGSDVNSVSLVFFGVDSFVEVVSASLVLWRFITESKPHKESAQGYLKTNLDKERKATLGIGILFVILALGTFSDAIISLIRHNHPETGIAGLIISIISLSFMGFLYLSKKNLAKNLNSSTMASEAQCSLACIKITVVVFLGSILYVIWKDGWWLDSAAALILGLFFVKEGVEMIIWARSKNFSGGCCKGEESKDAENVILCSNSSGCCKGGESKDAENVIVCSNSPGCEIKIVCSNSPGCELETGIKQQETETSKSETGVKQPEAETSNNDTSENQRDIEETIKTGNKEISACRCCKNK
ncbi:9544_t:CDS:1 [Ambispora gerdemannii]|uniref:9544_t:CDS:1 n=1 Tax=Ambispora gerdemannii TaxID=144530 RepID=A0A9N8YL24_9GLOM|nr:9544_t:CDS:1 [Ambispora gerdemannii]